MMCIHESQLILKEVVHFLLTVLEIGAHSLVYKFIVSYEVGNEIFYPCRLQRQQ